METSYAEFAVQDAQIIALAHQTIDEAALTVEQISRTSLRVSFPVVADVDRSVHGRYNVINPSVFIIDQNGQIVWDYIGEGISDRPSVTAILSNLP